ncbi:MAG: penicillin-binding transpeptidase domain-containing protein [Myxococcota bacterium]|nr:penicillin-binding transpeptidase domain-containing protein [Myxococcota bacterium]
MRSNKTGDPQPGGSRWRRAQRRRRQGRLSPRGRATLAMVTGLALLSGLVAFAVGWEPPGPVPSVQLASVDARPPQARTPDVPSRLLERLPVGRDTLELGAIAAAGVVSGPVKDSGVAGLIYEDLDWQGREVVTPLRVEYTLDAELTRQVFRVLRNGRVALGHVILLEPSSGRVLAYASTAPDSFPPTRAYPAASLVKILTAAAALGADPQTAELPCRFSGSPYRLTRSRIDPPRKGRTVSLRKALATSNNQCFAQLAVHAVGSQALLQTIARFGWFSRPAPAHDAGYADPGEDRYDLGRLGCGLAGARITPLHAAQLAAALAEGELVAPRWIERVTDARGRELVLPARPTPRRVMSPELTSELREMLVDTTRGGTATSAFRDRRRRPLLGTIRVAGKTGSLSGRDPTGRYEWFVGVAPAEAPRLAVATLLVQGDLYWKTASQVAAEVLRRAFCSDDGCAAENADRWRPHAATARLAGAPPPGA